MSAAIVTHGDAAPILEPVEHNFNLMALAVERCAIGVLNLTVSAWRDARSDAALAQGSAEPVAIVATIGEDPLGRRQSIEQEGRSFVAAHRILRAERHVGRRDYLEHGRSVHGRPCGVELVHAHLMSGTWAPSYGAKPAAAVLDYAYSFADEIAANEPDDTLASATLTIAPDNGSLGASRIAAAAATSEGRTLVPEPSPVVMVT